MPPSRAIRSSRSFVLLATLFVAAACSAPPKVATARETPLRIASYNIRHGRGTDDALDLARTAKVLGSLTPDIVGLQEVDDRVERSGRVNEAEWLGHTLGMQHAFGAFMPYQGGEYGLAILSRYPIESQTAIRLPDGNEPRVALLARLRLPNGRPLAVVNVHFDWVKDDGFRFAQATALSQVLDTLSVPYVLLGDFNDEPGSRTLALFQARAIELKKPRDDHFTFSSTEPVKEIDFVFVAPAAAWGPGTAKAVTERLASDHRPVIATVAQRAR
jgi:endonuclease/exonuclease/phosphatase family metal-dependent hydrolase